MHFLEKFVVQNAVIKVTTLSILSIKKNCEYQHQNVVYIIFYFIKYYTDSKEQPADATCLLEFDDNVSSWMSATHFQLG